MYPGEDVDLDRRLIRMGYKVLFTPDAVVYHHRVDSPQRWVRMLMNYGGSQADNIAIHGFFRRIHVVPPMMMLSVLVLALILWQRHIALAVMMLAMGVSAPAIYLKRRGLALGWNDTLYFTVTTTLYFFAGFWKRVLRNSIRPKFPLGRNLEVHLE
jgi:GT2 family glycosyltransferase